MYDLPIVCKFCRMPLALRHPGVYVEKDTGERHFINATCPVTMGAEMALKGEKGGPTKPSVLPSRG
jgi:hypothetical protein